MTRIENGKTATTNRLMSRDTKTKRNEVPLKKPANPFYLFSDHFEACLNVFQGLGTMDFNTIILLAGSLFVRCLYLFSIFLSFIVLTQSHHSHHIRQFLFYIFDLLRVWMQMDGSKMLKHKRSEMKRRKLQFGLLDAWRLYAAANNPP